MYEQDGQPSAASEFNENTWHPSCFCLWMLCDSSSYRFVKFTVHYRSHSLTSFTLRFFVPGQANCRN